MGLADPALLAELQELGFTPDTVTLVPLVPILETAWAEGGVSPAERALIVDLARRRGAMLESGARTEMSADELIKYCEDIAAASGGIFGLGKVSADERATLSRIAAALKK